MDKSKDKLEHMSQAEEVPNVESSEQSDQDRIALWGKAREVAPTEESVLNFRSKMEDAQKELEKATAAYEKAAAHRATVVGWKEVADEENVTAKMLHTWHRRHVPDLEDMTDVPRVIIPRQERRIKSAEEKIKKQEEERRKVQESAAKFRELTKGWKN